MDEPKECYKWWRTYSESSVPVTAEKIREIYDKIKEADDAMREEEG